jgi:hypothetical protein
MLPAPKNTPPDVIPLPGRGILEGQANLRDQSSKSLGSLNTTQAKTITNTKTKGIGSIVTRHKNTPNKQGGFLNLGAIFGSKPKPSGPATKIPILSKTNQTKLPVTDRMAKFMKMDKDRILLEVEDALADLKTRSKLDMNALEVEDYFEEVLRTPFNRKISDATKETLARLLAQYSRR